MVILKLEKKLAKQILESLNEETKEKIEVYNFRTFKNLKKEFLKDKVTSSKEYFIEEYVFNLLIQLGMPINLKGFEYIKYIVCSLIKDPKQSEKNLYRNIGEIYDNEYYNVTYCIRAAIKKAYKKANIKLYEEVFKKTYEECKNLKNYEYIFYIVEYVKSNLGKYL